MPEFDEPAKRCKDSWLWPTILVPLLVHIYLDIDFAFHPENDFAICWIFIALALLWSSILLIRAIFSISLHLKKKTISFAVSFLCLFLGGMFIKVGDYIRFATEYSKYEAIVSKSPDTRQEFKQGHYGFVSALSGQRTLVYDPEDTLPQENQIKDYNVRKKFNHFTGIEITTTHIFGHFYIVDEIY